MPIEGKYLDTHETAARLGLSRQRIGQLIREGRLDARKFGRDWAITIESVNRLRDETQAKATA